MEQTELHKNFDLVLENASDHFFENYIKISLLGEPLSDELCKLSKKMGVKNPERVRLLKTSETEFLKICGVKKSVGFLKYLPALNNNKYRFCFGFRWQRRSHRLHGGGVDWPSSHGLHGAVLAR